LTQLLPLAAWVTAIYNPPRVMAVGLLTPLLLLGLIWMFFQALPAKAPGSAQRPSPTT